MSKQYKPARIEEKLIKFVDDYVIGSNYTEKLEFILEDFSSLLELTRRELSLIFSENEFLFFINVLDTDFVKEFEMNSNYKQILTSKVQDALVNFNFAENFNIDNNIILGKIEKISTFSAYTLIYIVFKYNKLYADSDINNTYFKMYFYSV
ncbi:hypothetical protein [Clostridium akagii]|uniref:hypothetical protein n=1 Tax=Clostridium akagii TaxID=91623 RepID=UPI000479BCB0|nr:hypothetical protein [Clostridium akagii]